MPTNPSGLRLNLHQADGADTSAGEAEGRQPAPVKQLARLVIKIEDLSVLLARSVASLHRDDAAGRLPAALWIGGSKRWRYAEIAAWVEAGCPSRLQWNAMNRERR